MKRMMSPASSSSSSLEKKQRLESNDSIMFTNPTMSILKMTSSEDKLFHFLLQVAAQPQANGVVLRVAGGWVRDKLLGRESDDVDIVLDSMTGHDFAALVNLYETSQGHDTRAIGVIKANPEQSKHLETATMQMGENMGSVDFVNLRAETYTSEDNRIPIVRIGTPQQDAERRDFTINSLFYNLATKQVEDFTRRGIEDLRNGRLRTPLDPRVTFLDDPLRVLRAVRFASRFNCTLEEDLRAAAQLEEVRIALVRKVSRERVGKEVSNMLTGRAAHPERALRLLHELKLCESVFLPSPLLEKTPICCPDGKEEEVDENVWNQSYAYVYEMYMYLTSGKVLDVDSLTLVKKQELQVRFLACVLLPFRGLCVRDKRRRLIATFVIQEALKLPNRDATDVNNVLAHVSELQAATLDTFDRMKTGLLVRSIGAQWEICRDTALVQELTDSGPADKSADARATVLKRYTTFTSHFHEAGLDGVWELKPLLNGNDLVKQLGVKPGPQMKEWLDRILAWQLANPEKSRNECMVHFKALVADQVS
ncbi:unnamed protein product [Peronospora belbahrii]|uniref:Poly A polymerase head domain-containing protein n=1 Tax=Peronospora belbahrii TaxID=622444 RepID=A0AAU9KLH8_9STRA|nr:unnamed protein product [Peronospora belbahrii]CAH0517564.1 unnamed protein product [Peronospora belbahrii]